MVFLEFIHLLAGIATFVQIIYGGWRIIPVEDSVAPFWGGFLISFIGLVIANSVLKENGSEMIIICGYGAAIHFIIDLFFFSHEMWPQLRCYKFQKLVTCFSVAISAYFACNSNPINGIVSCLHGSVALGVGEYIINCYKGVQNSLPISLTLWGTAAAALWFIYGYFVNNQNLIYLSGYLLIWNLFVLLCLPTQDRGRYVIN